MSRDLAYITDPAWVTARTNYEEKGLRCIWCNDALKTINDIDIIPHGLDVDRGITEEVITQAILANHSQTFLTKVTNGKTLNEKEVKIDSNTIIACRATVCAMIKAIHRLVEPNPQYRFIFLPSRPPNHHSATGQTHGFCVINSVMVGARYALTAFPSLVRKVSIIDIDAHIPCGSYECLCTRPDRRIQLYSIHERGLFVTSEVAMQRKADKLDHTVHFRGVDGYCDQDTYWNAFLDLMRSFDHVNKANPPDLILISCGFDGCFGEDISHLPVTPQMFHVMTKMICERSPRVVSILEGGYKQQTIKTCLPEHIRGARDGKYRQ